MIDNRLIAEYINLLDELKEAADRKTYLEGLKKELAAKIHTMLAAEGVGKVNVRGVTVAPKRTMRASSADMPALIEALKAEGLDALVGETVNAQRLTGFVNEFDPHRMCGVDELYDRLPEGVRDFIRLYEDLGLAISRTS